MFTWSKSFPESRSLEEKLFLNIHFGMYAAPSGTNPPLPGRWLPGRTGAARRRNPRVSLIRWGFTAPTGRRRRDLRYTVLELKRRKGNRTHQWLAEAAVRLLNRFLENRSEVDFYALMGTPRDL